MIGELITTANTYNEGRTSINYAFSAETNFNSLSAETFYSGGTELSQLFGNNSNIQDGLNTYTAGTYSSQTVNISGGTFDNLTITGNNSFFYSASTQFLTINTGVLNWDISLGTNAYIVLTESATTFNIQNPIPGRTCNLFIVKSIGNSANTISLPNGHAVSNGGAGGYLPLTSHPNGSLDLASLQYLEGPGKFYWNVMFDFR